MMTQEQYDKQKQQIVSDERYPPALKRWLLDELDKAFYGGDFDRFGLDLSEEE